MARRWNGFDRQFTVFRQIITFALGVWVVVYAVTTSGKDLLFIFAGFALIGLIPVEDFFRGMVMARQKVEASTVRQEPLEPSEGG